ncbi:hypothetical protein ACPEEZ_10465 [Frigoribacterium sp. 2-23]|uniref:hypothetical protein n=1 Tax=Frigoribacterium sp. 2-23 TaxID=3415006 RepID=UPI003C6EEC02
MKTSGWISLFVVAGAALGVTACTTDGDVAPSTTSAPSPSASSSSTPGVPDSAPPVPVPTASAAGWTDDTAYQACVTEATSSQGADYTWSPRSSQVLVTTGSDKTMDVAGIYTGGDVGVANVTFRCVVGGTPGAPELSGSVLRG